jgi:xanthine dehydrogenase accessory factor
MNRPRQAENEAFSILVRGSGDVASAVSHRLFTAGFRVAIHDVPTPAAPRRGMAFTDALFDGTAVLEGVEALRVYKLEDLADVLGCHSCIPVLAQDFALVLERMRPRVLVDARMRKRAQPEIQCGTCSLTIGLGPNFVAGTTTDLVIETQWGADLGRIIHKGEPKALEGEPRNFGGHTRDRFIYAPAGGLFQTAARIGDMVAQGQQAATLDGHPLMAPMAGILRGLTHDRVVVDRGAKVVEVDPRGDPSAVFGIGERPAASQAESWRRSRSPGDDSRPPLGHGRPERGLFISRLRRCSGILYWRSHEFGEDVIAGL